MVTIGGSDIAGICGLSPFGGPADVWDKLMGVRALKPSLKMDAGTFLEDGIVKLWLHRSGLSENFAFPPNEKSTIRDWRRATPDRRLADGGVLEIKFSQNSDGSFGRTGTEKWPIYYQAQCAWYCSILDAPYATLVALIYGTETGRSALRLAEYNYERNEDFERMLIDKGQDFMDKYVLRGVRPGGDFDTSQKADDLFDLPF